jgi:ribonuclease HI
MTQEKYAEHDGMVCYADAGARPTNPGHCGYGIHGYMYVAAHPKKGLGNGQTATNKGYCQKDEYQEVPAAVRGEMSRAQYLEHMASLGKPCPVSIVQYFEEVTAHGIATNNVGELVAVTRTMELALSFKTANLHVLTDSEYVRKGAQGWVDRWVSTGWKKPDGGEIQNVAEWKKFLNVRQQLSAAGTKFTIDRVPGHAGFLGNEEADALATIGIYLNMNDGIKRLFTTHDPDGYWKHDSSRHPFINNRSCYFNTLGGTIIPGHYYLGNHGQDDEDLGTRDREGHFGVVILDKPEDAIEKVRETQARHSGGADSLYVLYLDNLYNPTIHRRMTKYGDAAVITPSGYRLSLKYLDETPITRELKPARLAMRAVDQLSRLQTLLGMFEQKDPALVVTDITSSIYDVSQKSVKPKKGEVTVEPLTTMKIKTDLAVGMTMLKVDVLHPFSKDENDKIEVTLSTNVDIIDRNALKRLEDLNPQVSVIAWQESPKVFRYATVIKTNDARGIWAGVHSNLRIVP